jgi:AcrR family transcriptional regulator
MTGPAVTTRSPIEAMRSVPVPEPALNREREAGLTTRQRQILRDLSAVFAKGFLNLTMADLAARLNCSLRTLYLLAESRNELVMIVIDRVLRSHGRAAYDTIDTDMSALEAIRSYLHAANNAVSEVTEEFATDMAAVVEGVALNEAHNTYLIDVTQALLDLAVEQKEIRSVDTSALARMLGGMGRDFARPEVLVRLRSSPAVAANAMVDLVLDGLESDDS